MNRCARRPLGGPWAGLLASALALALLPPAAHAQGRMFPEQALRGLLVVNNPPAITINDQPARLSPGSRIRDTSNRIVFAQGLIGQQLVVNYTRESTGQVHEIWLLTPAEAAQPRAGASDMVIRNYSSGTATDSTSPTP